MPPDNQDNNSFLAKIKNLFIDLKNNLSLSKSLKILGILILLVGLPAGLYLVQKTQIFRPKAFTPKDQIDILTEQLLQADQKYDVSAVKVETTSKETQDQLNTMKGIAIRRKELLLQKIKDNPQEFLDKATLTDKINTFPEAVRPYIEEKIQTQGKLTVVHIDDFENKKSRYEYFLEKGDNKLKQEKFKLYFVKDPPKVLSGSEVKVNGVELEQQVALSTGNAQPNQEGLQIIAAAILPPAIGEQKTAVLLVNFSDDPNNKPLTLDRMRSLIFGTNNADVSVDIYYKENSFNKVNFTGNVFGWYTITSGECKDSFGDWTGQTYVTATKAGVDLTLYDRLLYFFPTKRGCDLGVWGKGSIGGNPSIAVVYGTQDVGIYIHEIGHNLGSQHANRLECGMQAINNYSLCSEQEYGDEFDIMGSTRTPIFQFNGPHKAGFGWIPDVSIKEITTNGTYIVSELESSNTGVQILKIPKGDTNEQYFISYRQKKGFDMNLPDAMIKGASIHIWNNIIYRQTNLIDVSPSVPSSFYDPVLYDGAVFNDPVNNISIKQISHISSTPTTPGSVTIQVSFKEIINPNPTPTPTPTPPPKLLSSWTSLTALPFGIKNHSLVAYKSKLFVIGGFPDSGPQNKVYSASINNTGILGSWNELVSNALPLTLYNFGLVAERNYLFVIGGESDSQQIRQSAIYSSKVDDAGTLGPWNELKNTPLPQKLFRPSTTSVNGYIYVSGGYYTSLQFQFIYESKVYSALVNSDGTLGNWNELTTTPLPKALTEHKSVVANGFIFVLGGRNQDNSRSLSVYSSKVNNDGTLGNWNELKNTPLPLSSSDFYILSAAVTGYENYLLLIGGYSGIVGYSKEVYVAKVNSDGTLGNWTTDTPLPSGLALTTTATWGNRIFTVGGEGSNTYRPLFTVYSTQITLPVLPSPSPTPSPTPFVCNACAADMNKDGAVTILDFSILSTCFNKLATDTSRGVACNKADVNNDGAITILDFSCFASKFNLQCLLGQEKGNSAPLDQETRRSLQAQLLKESDTPPASSQTIQPSQGERPAAQGTVEPPRSTNLVTAAVNLITNAVQGQKSISKAVTNITLLRRSNNQETDFLSTIDLTGLDWGDNFFVIKRYFSDGTAEEVANSSFKITVVSKCQEETARDLGEGVAQNFFICEDGREIPNGDKYCINGNPDPNDCQQISQPGQFSEQPSTSEGSGQSFSQDNGEGTYTETKDGISKQYRFSDHAEVLGKCRDTDRNNNVIVKVESGRDRVDINCEDLGQGCEEYLNEEGKQDARCT